MVGISSQNPRRWHQDNDPLTCFLSCIDPSETLPFSLGMAPNRRQERAFWHKTVKTKQHSIRVTRHLVPVSIAKVC